MPKRKKKRFPYILLFLLVAVFLTGVGYWAQAPQTKETRKVWSAPVHVVEKPVPEALSTVDIDEILPEEVPLPEPLPEPSKQPALASTIAPALPRPKHVEPSVEGNPRIAIVIDDLGLSAVNTERAIALPAAVTLSFLPYGVDLQRLTERARDAGHEVLLHMPMEPMGRENPGKGALLVALPPEEIRARLENAMARFSGFDGINNHMGSKFTADLAGMDVVADVLRERNLFFLDSYTSVKSVGAKIAQENGVLTATRDVFLDDNPALSAINAQLAQTELTARRKGYAIAIGHPHASTLTALKQWLPEAQRQGFVIVPVKDLAR